MTAYYNENDRFAAEWLRQLIAAGHIAPGIVDERSITEVVPSDLNEFDQCHFFAGIGVWSYALRQAGWPDDRPVWTGSCPCQPFSAAGKREGFSDPRHLWPEWYRLIRECHPESILGEQVAQALAWFDVVSGELESEGYAVGATVLGAHSVGAPHIRQRLYFVADSAESRRQTAREHTRGSSSLPARPAECSGVSELGHTSGKGLSQRKRDGRVQQEKVGTSERETAVSAGYVNGFWADSEWLYCRDEKYRPIKPGIFPLVDGTTRNRVGKLRGAGNALCAPQATAFVRAYMEGCGT